MHINSRTHTYTRIYTYSHRRCGCTWRKRTCQTTCSGVSFRIVNSSTTKTGMKSYMKHDVSTKFLRTSRQNLYQSRCIQCAGMLCDFSRINKEICHDKLFVVFFFHFDSFLIEHRQNDSSSSAGNDLIEHLSRSLKIEVAQANHGYYTNVHA